MGASKSQKFFMALGVLAVLVLIAGCSSQSQMGAWSGDAVASSDAAPTSLAAGDAYGRTMFPPTASQSGPVVASDD
jgi:hypothetical protein